MAFSKCSQAYGMVCRDLDSQLEKAFGARSYRTAFMKDLRGQCRELFKLPRTNPERCATSMSNALRGPRLLVGTLEGLHGALVQQ